MGKTKDFRVLKNCTGFANPGETLYIMGASGAGKTSLLNILTDRVTLDKSKRVEGQILMNDNFQLKQSLFSKYATYVMQDDVLFKYFTVKEAMTFAARLRLKVS
jgi:ABC-type multidrug transport system ATPase subunit